MSYFESKAETTTKDIKYCAGVEKSKNAVKYKSGNSLYLLITKIQ